MQVIPIGVGPMAPAHGPESRQRGRYALFVARSAALALALGTTPARAAGASEDLGALLDRPFEALLATEIRSAGKRAEELRDIPASVTILTREEIARYGWQTLEQVLRNIPGLYLLDNTEERFIGTRGAAGGGVQFLVNGVAQHPARQKTLTVPEIARLNVPVEAIDRIEVIRGPMSVIYGNNAFLGVANIVTDDLAAGGSRVSASLGTRGMRGLFARLGKETADGFLLLNAGVRGDDGLAGAYADMLSPGRLAALDPAMRRDMDGDLDQREGSLELTGRWRGLSADLRWTRRDYGIYAFTPAFDDGTRVQLDTLHLSLGLAHRFSDSLGLRVTAIHSREDYHAYQTDFLRREIDGSQRQGGRRSELELDLHWRRDHVDALLGYRLLAIHGVHNRIDIPGLLQGRSWLDDYQAHDLFAEVGWQAAPTLRLVTGARLGLLPGAYRSAARDPITGEVIHRELRGEDDHQLDGRVALLWTPSPSQVVKLIWGSASQDSADGSFAELERIQSLELNGTLTGAGFALGASLFRNRVDNLARSIQVLDPTTGEYRSVDDNSGRWRTWGAELTLEARALPRLPNLGLAASLAWQDTEDLATGIEPGYSPGLVGTLRADYGIGPFTLAAFGHYVDGMEADWDFVVGASPGVVTRIGEPMPGYWDLGLNLRWDPPGEGPYAALNVANLLDTDNRSPANELTNLDLGLIGPGRTLTLTLGLSF